MLLLLIFDAVDRAR